MKKISIFLVTIFSFFLLGVSTFAEVEEELSFKVEFKSNPGDGSGELNTLEKFNAQIESSTASTDISLISLEKVYYGKNGLKFSSSSINGKLNVALNKHYFISKIVIEAYAWKGAQGVDNAQVTVTAGDYQDTITGLKEKNDTVDSYTLTLTGEEQIDKLSFAFTKRGYLKAFEVFYNDNNSPFVLEETMASLKLVYDASLRPVDVDLRFGAKINSKAYFEEANYGVLVTTSTFSVSGIETEYASVKEFLLEHQDAKKVECKPVKLEDDTYQFAWVITDMEGHYLDNLTAMIYMEHYGTLYLGKPKTTSVKNLASIYLYQASSLDLDNDVITVLTKLASWEA